MAQKRLIWVLTVIALLAGCDVLKEKLFTPRIQVKCRMPQGVCSFVNHGDPGETCVQVEVFRPDNGQVLRSKPVCSGLIDRLAPVERAVEFGAGDPVQLCMGKNLEENFALTCQVSVVDASPEGAP